VKLGWADVCAQRQQRQGLSAPLGNPAEVADAVCGVHAQVMSAAELSIGLRLDGATSRDVQDELWVERSLVKTFGPRGTVHLLPARDLPMWTGALSAIPSTRRQAPEIRFTPSQTQDVIAAIGAAIEDAELTVDELSDAVIAATGPWAREPTLPAFQGAWPRWRQVMHEAAHQGVLCFGPNRGRNVTYTHPRRWVPGFAPSPGPAALAEVLRRYLHAYGPATPAQFARWFGILPGPAAALFESLDVVPVDLDGTPAWLAPGDSVSGGAVSGDAVSGDAVSGDASGSRRVRLLPYFDAYGVGSFPRELVFPGVAASRALARGQAGNYPVLTIDGVVRGVWHQRRTARRADVTVEPFASLTTRQRRELVAEVARIGAFFECTAELTIGPVTAGAHA
jgi:hypothetical protein